MRILIAEDNRNFGLIMKRELEDRGYVVDLVDNGVSALQCFSEFGHDTVLLDIRMPEMNGIDALRQIKRMKPETLAITFSGNASRDEKQQALNAGAVASLDKPFLFESLVNYFDQDRDFKNI